MLLMAKSADHTRRDGSKPGKAEGAIPKYQRPSIDNPAGTADTSPTDGVSGTLLCWPNTSARLFRHMSSFIEARRTAVTGQSRVTPRPNFAGLMLTESMADPPDRHTSCPCSIGRTQFARIRRRTPAVPRPPPRPRTNGRLRPTERTSLRGSSEGAAADATPWECATGAFYCLLFLDKSRNIRAIDPRRHGRLDTARFAQTCEQLIRRLEDRIPPRHVTCHVTIRLPGAETGGSGGRDAAD